MYAGRERSVPLPTEGHLHILKNGYVYWESECKWDNDAKRPANGRRIIGKLDPDDASKLFPNSTYQQLFEGIPEPRSFSRTLSFGAFAAVREAAEKVGCLPVLREVFPVLADRIFALALHSICAENSTAQDFPFWCFHNYCGLEHRLSSEEISDIYEEISREENAGKIEIFMERFRLAYHDALPDSTLVCLAFDSTNQSSASKGSRHLAEFGHAKQNEGIPQINTAMFVDERTGIPLFYEHFLGSVLDKSQTPFTLAKASSLGFRKLFLMMDRGYFSASAAKAFTSMDMEFAVMSPSHVKAAQDLIDAYKDEVMNREQHYIVGEKIYGIHVPHTDILDGTYDAYVFYDYNRANEERNHIHAAIDLMGKTVRSRKRYSKKMQSAFAPWLTITRDPQAPKGSAKFSFEVNGAAVQKELSQAGFFVVVSNSGLDAAAIIRAARMRDTDEKGFRRLKWHFGLTSPYTHTLETYEGKMFVAFIALIIVESFRWFTHNALGKKSGNTVPCKLGELNKYEIWEKSPGSWVPAFAATKEQKAILNSLGMTEASLEPLIKSVHAIV